MSEWYDEDEPRVTEGDPWNVLAGMAPGEHRPVPDPAHFLAEDQETRDAAFMDWLFNRPPPTSHPTQAIRHIDHPDRPPTPTPRRRLSHYGVRNVPRALRRAEIVCQNRTGRFSLLGIVLAAPHDRVVFAHHSMMRATVHIREDAVLDCRCGIRHYVDGTKLWDAVLAAGGSGNRVPRINVRDVERLAT